MAACIAESSLCTLDQQTADLILQLQLEDAEVYFSSTKGKGREGEVSDEMLAFELQRQEIENMSLFRTDNRMARSMGSAVVSDGELLSDAWFLDDIAARDREIAHQLDRGIETSDAELLRGSTIILDDETLEKLRLLYVSGFDDSPSDDDDRDFQSVAGDQPESSTWAASRSGKLSTASRRCEACRETVKFVDIARLPCQHEYCRKCLAMLFEASMTDESLFPPRCCRQPISVSSVRLFLDLEVVQEFARKTTEFQTPNRTYCYSPTCSAFIHPRNINGEMACCDDCGLQTCTTCKAEGHNGDCPNDTALQQVLETAREMGWQRCHSCWSLVELEHGCNHMTCRCGAQFCYVCGQPWKNCACEQWNEHRLYARANQIIDRQQERRVAAQIPGLPAANDYEGHAIEDPLPEPPGITDQQPAGPGQPQEPHDDVVPEEVTQPINEAIGVADTPQTARERLLARTMQNLRENHEWDLINARSVPIFLKDTFLSAVGVTYRPAIDADEIDCE
ncbi:related to IBR finger domain protein [Rhynchosporium agropyri]|uniref:RBR-type E3 ubiquitin transferase n=1 Tax=Rhynchosporium agropyri TaxID=914238 RepID=A0A1E1L8W1_9HELO|nr:related to IBR finger domain protein [Rhynchosporium agropyri]